MKCAVCGSASADVVEVLEDTGACGDCRQKSPNEIYTEIVSRPMFQGEKVMSSEEMIEMLRGMEPGEKFATNNRDSLTFKEAWVPNGESWKLKVSCEGSDGGSYLIRFYESLVEFCQERKRKGDISHTVEGRTSWVKAL